MQEVIVMIYGETANINVLRVFHSKNPKTNRHHVNVMDASNEKWVRLSCQDEEAETLAQNIRDGKKTDLTSYQAEWNL